MYIQFKESIMGFSVFPTNIEKLYTLAVEHPRFGKMNAAEMLVVLSGHTERHCEQIREILHG